MTNEMKLLMALCDALGFEVDTVEDIKHLYKREDCLLTGEPMIGVMPSSIINVTDYKLTKKSSTIAEIKAIMPSSEANYEISEREVLSDDEQSKLNKAYVLMFGGKDDIDMLSDADDKCRAQRKSNLSIALLTEFNAGVITLDEYIEKLGSLYS
jgi:hypothetical protein